MRQFLILIPIKVSHWDTFGTLMGQQRDTFPDTGGTVSGKVSPAPHGYLLSQTVLFLYFYIKQNS